MVINYSGRIKHTRVVVSNTLEKMDQEFFERKIKALNDQRLIDLIKLRNGKNQGILQLAIEEAKRRNLKIIEQYIDSPLTTEDKANGIGKLDKWNWGAFLLAPFWALANKLDKWALLCFIPGVNIVVVFYLGFRGNRIAYNKSSINSVDDFMVLQQHWSKWGKRMLWVSVALSVVWILFNVSA